MDEQLIQPTPLIIGYTVVFILVSIGIGIYANKYAKSAEGFFGGTKAFGGMVIGLASAAAVIAPSGSSAARASSTSSASPPSG